jgi:hypothetical protein
MTIDLRIFEGAMAAVPVDPLLGGDPGRTDFDRELQDGGPEPEMQRRVHRRIGGLEAWPPHLSHEPKWLWINTY